MKLKNITNSTTIAQDVKDAGSFFKRLRGLMFTKDLSPQAAIYIHPCRGIHTYFMNYNIDVLYLDFNNIIIALDEDMKPKKIGRYVSAAVAVIELKGGRAKETNTKVGDKIEFER